MRFGRPQAPRRWRSRPRPCSATGQAYVLVSAPDCCLFQQTPPTAIVKMPIQRDTAEITMIKQELQNYSANPCSQRWIHTFGSNKMPTSSKIYHKSGPLTVATSLTLHSASVSLRAFVPPFLPGRVHGAIADTIWGKVPGILAIACTTDHLLLPAILQLDHLHQGLSFALGPGLANHLFVLDVGCLSMTLGLIARGQIGNTIQPNSNRICIDTYSYVK